MKGLRNFIIITAVLIILITINRSCQQDLPTEEEGEAWLNDSFDSLTVVANYLETYDYPLILIKSADGKMNLLLSEIVEIDDRKVNEAIADLFSRGIKSISMDEEDNCIAFDWWRNQFGVCVGLAYSLDGTDDFEIQYMTKRVPLSKERWYYFVDDYETYRSDPSKYDELLK